MEFDDKLKSIIMVGAAKAVKCGPCLEHAVNWAVEAGCSEADIAQALGVGAKVRDGAHQMMSDQADEQLADVLEVVGINVITPLQAEDGCGDAPCPCR